MLWTAVSTGMEIIMKVYETHHLVKGEDLNHHGTLYAARAAAWFVEAAFAAVACTQGSAEGIVCRNLHNMSFSKPVSKGSVVDISSRVVYVGETSLMVAVEVVDAMSGEKAVDGFVTFVTIEQGSGRKKAHGIVLDEPQDEAESKLRRRALEIRGEAKCTN